MKNLFFIVLIVLTSIACEDGDEFDAVPTISLVSIAPSVITEFQDSLVISISYEDGDGDLGGGHADSSDLFAIDDRIGIPYEFRIRDLVPNNGQVPIKGQINITINNLFLIDTLESENVSFEVFLFDQNGNESNHLNTPSIKVVR